MYPDDRVRGQHMLDYARTAIRIAEGHDRSSLDRDETLALALARCIEIIGEAASHTTQGFQAEHPEIPWPDVIGMRHRLVHAYVDVDLNVLWATVTEDLPPLVEVLEGLLPPER